MALANSDELHFLAEEAEVQETKCYTRGHGGKSRRWSQPVGAHVLLKTTLRCLLTLKTLKDFWLRKQLSLFPGSNPSFPKLQFSRVRFRPFQKPGHNRGIGDILEPQANLPSLPPPSLLPASRAPWMRPAVAGICFSQVWAPKWRRCSDGCSGDRSWS